MLPSPASVIVWTECPPRQTYYEDRATSRFDPTRVFNDAKPDMVVERGFLFIAHQDGKLTVMTTNLDFVIARIRVIPPHFRIRHLHVTNSLSHCLVLGYREGAEGTESGEGAESADRATKSGGSNGDDCLMRFVQIDFLLEFASEIERVTQEVVAIKAHFMRFQSALKQVEDSWVDGIRSVLMGSIVKPLQGTLEDYSETADVWDLLYNTFCGLRQKGALLHFLGNDVGENGAKEVLRSFVLHNEDTELNMFKLITVGINALSRASEYRGLSRLTSRFSPIGVCFDDANAVFQAADNFLGSLLEFSRKQGEICEETTAFLIWLINAAMKAGGEYEQTRSLSNAHSMHARRTELAANFLCKMNKIKHAQPKDCVQDAVDVMFTTNLQPVLKRWQECCRQVIRQPSLVISKALRVYGGVSFRAGLLRSPGLVKCSVFDCRSDGSVVAFLPLTDGSMLCARHMLSTGVWSFAKRSLHTDGYSIDDAVMTSETSAVLLMSDRHEEGDMVDGKVHVQIGMYDVISGDLWKNCETIRAPSDADAVCARVEEGAPICRLTCGWSFSGYSNSTHDMILSVNRETGIMR